MKRLILDVREEPARPGLAGGVTDGSRRDRLPTLAGMCEREIGPRFRELADRVRVFADVGAAEGFFSLSLRCGDDATVSTFESASEIGHLLIRRLEDRASEPTVATETGPALLKIEVEGDVVEVLEGSREVLGWLETRVMVKVHDGPTESRCLRLLEGFGFAVEIIGPAWWRRSIGRDRSLPEVSHWLIAEKPNLRTDEKRK